jgi:hypothetical protein
LTENIDDETISRMNHEPFASFIENHQTLTGVVVGGLISCITALLTNWLIYRKQIIINRDTNVFDAKQQAIQNALRAVSKIQLYIFGFINKPTKEYAPVDAEINELYTALSDLQLYCSKDTIECSYHTKLAVEDTIRKIASKKVKADLTMAEIDSNKIFINKLENLTQTIQAEINALLQSNPSDPIIADKYKRIASIHHDISKCWGNINTLQVRRLAEINICFDEAIKQLPSMLKSVTELLLQSRKELNLTIGEEEFLRIIRNADSQSLSSISQAIDEIRQTTNENLPAI